MMFQLLVLFIRLIVCNGQQIVVFENTLPLNESKPDAGLELVRSSIRMDSDFNKGFSICLRFNYALLGRDYGPMFYFQESLELAPFRRTVECNVGSELSFLYFFDYNWLLRDIESNSVKIWTPSKWHHVCMSFDSKALHLNFIKDGSLTNINNTVVDFKSDRISTNVLDSLKIGRKSDDGTGSYGSFSDFNLWDFPLSLQDMLDWTKCNKIIKGNIVDWSQARWKEINMEKKKLDYSDLCKPKHLGPVYIPEKLSAKSAMNFCKTLSGKLLVISDQSMFQMAASKLREENLTGYHDFLWTGWWDEPTEGLFEDINGENLHFEDSLDHFDKSPWLLSEPNGYRIENCAGLRIKGATAFYDIRCDSKRSFFCDIDEPPTFRVRGLCEKSMFDTDFSWTGQLRNGKYAFQGFSKSFIFWDRVNQHWILQDVNNTSIFATTKGSNNGYPIGLNSWNVSNDLCDVDSVQLSFIACPDDKFNCQDGTCVDIEKQCDGRLDCTDNSDEFNCNMINFQPDVIHNLKSKPPPPAIQGNDQKLTMMMHMKVSDIHIDEVSSTFFVKLRVTLEWTESRVEFLTLKQDEKFNRLTQKELKSLWMPTLIFKDTKQSQLFTFDPPYTAYVKINNGSKSTQNGNDILWNGYQHSGRDCTLVVTQYFRAQFTHDFQMGLYPFDVQDLRGQIKPDHDARRFVELVPGEFKYEGPLDLKTYSVHQTLVSRDEEGRVVFKIILGRKLLKEILTTGLPTVIMVLVSFATNYFDQDRFDASVTVNLTSMLVLVTLFISVFQSLPATSTIKMIDIWFIFAFFVPFLEVILQTKMYNLKHDLNSLKQKTKPSAWTTDNSLSTQQIIHEAEIAWKSKQIKLLRRILTIGLPLVATLFLVSFFVAGFLLLEL